MPICCQNSSLYLAIIQFMLQYWEYVSGGHWLVRCILHHLVKTVWISLDRLPVLKDSSIPFIIYFSTADFPGDI